MRYIDPGRNPTTKPDPILFINLRHNRLTLTLVSSLTLIPHPNRHSTPLPIGKSFTKVPILPGFDPNNNPNDNPNTLDLITKAKHQGVTLT